MLGRLKNRMRRNGSSDSSTLNNGHGNIATPSSRSSNMSNSNTASPGTPRSTTGSFLGETSSDYNSKLSDLASFDACVEACDALAASSSYAQSSVTTDPTTGLKDCSVLVSPDGDLLLLPSAQQGEGNASNDVTARLQESEEYASSVFMGNDLKSDRSLNGYSAVGWSATAASLALRQSVAGLRDMTTFVEELTLSRKEAAARSSRACDQFVMGMAGEVTIPPLPLPPSIRQENGTVRRRRFSTSSHHSLADLEPLGSSSWKGAKSAQNTELDLTPARIGPLRYTGGTLHAGTVALEQFYSMVAEQDGDRWRRASIQGGILANLFKAADEAAERAYHREKALRDMQRRANDIEAQLLQCKEQAAQRWNAVHEAEEKVTKLVEERMLERSRERERMRMEQFEADNKKHQADSLGATTNEIWDIVSAATLAMEDGDFTPLDLPKARGPRDVTNSSESVHGVAPKIAPPTPSPITVPNVTRADVEIECELPELRAAAMAADDEVQETATSLLAILSTLDTTRRSAKVAAETCLLAACNAQASCLKNMVKLEKDAIAERMKSIEELERVVDNVDVRVDLDAYIERDKKARGGSTWLGADDDGGMASALAVLSNHVDGLAGMINGSPRMPKLDTEGWEDAEHRDITPEYLEEAVAEMFADGVGPGFEKTIDMLCKVAQDRGHPSSRSRRSTICYALNSKRAVAEVPSNVQFDALAEVIRAILTGCDRDPGGVANAKMAMMLAQTFFVMEEGEESSSEPRSKRIFVKSKLQDHAIWAHEEFWDQALYQCVTESLTHSGVMSNFERGNNLNAFRSEWTEQRKIRWHDLSHSERCEASSQVHAVVFAQLGALAHSMMEFGCGVERSCAFVRRMSVRNQLPLSQRTMLLQHVLRRSGEDQVTEPSSSTEKKEEVETSSSTVKKEKVEPSSSTEKKEAVETTEVKNDETVMTNHAVETEIGNEHEENGGDEPDEVAEDAVTETETNGNTPKVEQETNDEFVKVDGDANTHVTVEA